MDGQGIPLALLVQHFADTGCVVDWIDFYDTAVRHHWNPNTVLARIEEALADVFGREHCAAVLERLRNHIALGHQPDRGLEEPDA